MKVQKSRFRATFILPSKYVKQLHVVSSEELFMNREKCSAQEPLKFILSQIDRWPHDSEGHFNRVRAPGQPLHCPQG